MRKIIFILLSVLLINCSVDSDLQTPAETNPKWSLIQSIGGVAGTTTIFEENEINWTFNRVGGSLLVEHNISGISDALDPGTYDYSIRNIANQDFLFIDTIEYGLIIINRNRFVIDQNTASDGSSISDRFQYRFAR